MLVFSVLISKYSFSQYSFSHCSSSHCSFSYYSFSYYSFLSLLIFSLLVSHRSFYHCSSSHFSLLTAGLLTAHFRTTHPLSSSQVSILLPPRDELSGKQLAAAEQEAIDQAQHTLEEHNMVILYNALSPEEIALIYQEYENLLDFSSNSDVGEKDASKRSGTGFFNCATVSGRTLLWVSRVTGWIGQLQKHARSRYGR